MTGYLQRLASSVLHPGGNIHPVRDPVFSAPRVRTPPDTNESRESTALIPGADDSEEVRPPLTSTMNTKSVPKTSKSILPQPRSSDSSFLLLPPANGEASINRNAESLGNINGAKETLKSPLNENESTTEQNDSPLAMFASKNSVNSLADASAIPEVSEKTQSVAKNEPHEAMLAVSKISASKPSASLPQRVSPGTPGQKNPWSGTNRSPSSNTSSREPDEIEIHIGRIEVTAVQTAAPVPPAKPRRLAPSLDDYLRRRNRRNS